MSNQYLNLMAIRDKRSIVLAIATRTGIKDPESWDRFNQWMLTKSVLKKELYKYSEDELSQLIKQFRGLERNFLKSATKVGTKAWTKKNRFPNLSRN